MKRREGGGYGELGYLLGPLFFTIPIVRVSIATTDWTMIVVVCTY